MSCSVEMLKPVTAMVSVELSLAIVNILLKKALNGGMDPVIIIVYRQSVATIFLIPLACFWERLTLTQYLFLVGLDYTSATVSCAFINLVPVFTFVLALPLRMEKVDIKSKKGKAKVVGAMLSVLGALTLSLYKGVEVVSPRSSFVLDEEHRVRPERYSVGTEFLAAGCLAWSSWFLMQSRIRHYFHTSTLPP